MLKLGQYNKLRIVKRETFGVYMSETGEKEDERVLLPIKQVPECAGIGDELEVFLYKDSSDRLIATVNKPLLTVGEVTRLKVADVGRIGAFLDMGLERDLLLPFKEQTAKLSEGDEPLVTMYVDKSGRLAASMRVYHALRKDSPYKSGDDVTGTVYEITRDFGIYVAVDDIFSARIPKREAAGKVRVGDEIKARVTRVLEDGKLDISTRDKAFVMLDKDAELILGELKKNGGSLPLSDRSDPELVRERLGISKGAFKRAIGRLYKEKKIVINEASVTLSDDIR